MGASSWTSRVPYQQDIEAALELARQDAYDRGDYYRVTPNTQAQTMSEEQYVAWELAELRRSLAEAFGDDAPDADDTMARDSWRAAQVAVTGPDSLLDAQIYSGAHSVIDMTGVAPAPEPGMVAPVPDDVLEEVFGTCRPTADAIAGALAGRSLENFGRWHGAYVVAYDGEHPESIVFFGSSGD
ncbi:hypothetical protein [Catellatospora citrea]|uniref:Uncharacterized protein n=1 Tax=Catellatospora citrea TaxID=53366 RepID=A0A8J3NZT3_9ACTN|nr:hypothetical protein [Catellatospora citrea]RKE11199.1 hypothetical protein C8E86_6123 [Catellatospora citrea]GIF96665.1 hypothetical protein Cci01nite_17590 [Catellatospora citrea]